MPTPLPRSTKKVTVDENEFTTAIATLRDQIGTSNEHTLNPRAQMALYNLLAQAVAVSYGLYQTP